MSGPNFVNRVLNTIQTTSGVEVYTAKAWASFTSYGTLAIQASGNVTSITDNGVGDFTANFTNAMPNANYAVVTSSTSNTNANNVTLCVKSTSPNSNNPPQTKTASELRLQCALANQGLVSDSMGLYFACFG